MEQHVEQQYANAELRQLFPKMTPVSGPPTMFTLNGVGTTVYGERDRHELTNTYVKTLVFCILFVPIFFISSYRVQDAEEGGWYFLGKEPLSGFAKGWNYLVLSFILVMVGVGTWGGMQSNKAKRRPAYSDFNNTDRNRYVAPRRIPAKKAGAAAGLQNADLAPSKAATPKNNNEDTFLDDEENDTQPKPRKRTKTNNKKNQKGNWLE